MCSSDLQKAFDLGEFSTAETDFVSKTHALFVPASDGVLVTDLGSTNGTHIEDEEGVHRLSPGRPEYVHRGRQAYLGDGVCIVR